MKKLTDMDTEDFANQLWEGRNNILKDQPIKVVNSRTKHAITIKLNDLFTSIKNEDLANMNPTYEDNGGPMLDLKATLNNESAFAINLKHNRPRWNVSNFNKFFEGANEKDIPFILGFMASMGFPSAAMAF